jgi:two-component sensor histidine kinase
MNVTEATNPSNPFKMSNLDGELLLAKKVNSLTWFSILNMFIATLFVYINNYTAFLYECLFALLGLPFVLLFNKKGKTISAIYIYFCLDAVFLFFINLKMGLSSFVILYFFPLIFSVIQLLGTKRTIKHLIIISCILMLTVLITVIGLLNNWFRDTTSESSLFLILFNISLPFLSSIFVVLGVSHSSIHAQNVIKKMVTEKEILLAEVFHRVKNNMNIIISLLNLRKNNSSSIETHEALEECKNRVYSMSLIHQIAFEKDSQMQLDFNFYAEKLMHEITREMNTSPAQLNLAIQHSHIAISNAVPFGIILNELYTNSYKHAKKDTTELCIYVGLRSIGNQMIFTYSDNGPGLEKSKNSSENTLGFELIKSLSEQLNGSYRFYSMNGFNYELIFQV